MGEQREYRAGEVVMTIFSDVLGSRVLGGLSEGNVVLRRNTDRHVLKKGRYDNGSWTTKSDTQGEIEAPFLGSSQDNDFMTALHNLGLPFRVVVADLSGTTVGESASTKVMKLPDKTLGASSDEDVTWVLKAARLKMTVGGNFG